jgi:tetratricopeptide (TPR) repeat protein
MLDFRGSAISGATPGALEAFERALAMFQCWRGDPDLLATTAEQEAPQFVMAHVLQAWLLLCGREPTAIRAATPILARALALPANERERLHLAAAAAVVDDDYPRARAILAAVSEREPHDVLALQVAHAFDYLTGDAARMRDSLSGILGRWSDALPGYHAVLAMYAFGLEECGEYRRAEDFALHALEHNPLDARAHHALAHVFEMTGRADEGLRWMGANMSFWAHGTTVATHCWWHLALFQIGQGRRDLALALYDQHVRTEGLSVMSDLIDASALLWRIVLKDGDVGERWNDVAKGWTPHIGDGFCTFSDLHAMMAFVGAGDRALAENMLQNLSEGQFQATRYGEMTRMVGLPACRALLAFGREDFASTAALLGGLPGMAYRLGGSHAQRDVIYLTLLKAVERIRRHPGRLRAVA